MDETEAALKHALVGLKIQETMRHHLLQLARDQTRHTFVVVTGQGPTAVDENVDYRSLASEGLDTVLEITVPAIGMAGEWGINPPLAVFMTARARLIRIADGTVLHVLPLEYTSGTRAFTEWAANNAQPFRDELDRAYQNLAERIVEQLFLRYVPLP